MLPPDRKTAYMKARAADQSAKGLGYTELFLDNILNTNPEYESFGNSMYDAFSRDKLGFVKNAAVGAYEGARDAVMHPIDTATGLAGGIYNSGMNVASTLGSDPIYLDNALMEMFGVTYEQATDEQVSKAREALFGDVLNVAGMVPAVGAVGKGAKALSFGSKVPDLPVNERVLPPMTRPEVPEVPELDEATISAMNEAMLRNAGYRYGDQGPDPWANVSPDPIMENPALLGDVEEYTPLGDFGDYTPDGMRPEVTGEEGTASPEWLRPAVIREEGIASLYSPTRKAVDLLDRPTYDNLDSLRVQLLNRGAKPDEVARVLDRVRGETGPIPVERLAQAADEQIGELQVRRVNAKNTPYGSEHGFATQYFVDGVEDQQANIIELPVAKKPDFSEAHFAGSGPDRAPIVHTRTGMLSTKGANKPDSYHVGEIQSDYAQKRAKLFPDVAAALKARDRLVEVNDELGSAYNEILTRERELIDDGIRDYESDPQWVEIEQRYSALGTEVKSLNERMNNFRVYGDRSHFDATYPAPYVGTTSKWVQLGLRQSLLDAVNSGARQMSFSTGEMVKSYTYGELKGQQKFYDDIVPKELNEVLKKFAKEAGIKKPELQMDTVYGNQGQEYLVPTLKFSDEFVEAVKRNGLPAFAKGGVVSGSLLDVDLFGDQR